MDKKKKKIPALRFPEFVGEWEKNVLGDISEWASGGTPAKEELTYWYGDLPWITASSMRGSEFSDSELKITKEGLINGSRLALKGSILILVRGSMLFKKIPVGIATRDVAFNQDVKSITITTKSTSKFILYWFKASENELLNMVVGTGIGAGKLELSDLKRMRLFIPTLSEQQKIADFLTAVDDKINQLTRKKTLLEQYKKGVMQKIFSQEIRFPEFEGEWEEKRLQEISNINPTCKKLPEEFIYIDLESVEKGMLKKEEKILLRNAPSRAQRYLQDDDILFQTVRPYQKNNYYFSKGDGYVASTGYVQLRTNHNAKFLFHFLHTDKFVRKVLVRCTGTSYPAINSNDLAQISIILPSLPEQQKIADFLTGIDKKIELVNTQLEKTKEWKKGLLQQMFV